MDLEKLTPAPWRMKRRYSNGCEIVPRIHCEPSKDRECGWIADCVGAPYLGYESTLVNAEFIALARNAFDVMMRRGWWAKFDLQLKLWKLSSMLGAEPPRGIWAKWITCNLFPDPFTALVEADAWYKANVEKAPA